MKKNPSSSGVRNSLPQLRGAAARRWRHWLASASHRPADSVRTLKFKLDFPEGIPVNFEQIRALNRVVDGVAEGSLTGLLMAVHSSGLRVFMQEAGAVQFRQTNAGLAQGFDLAFSALGFTMSGFNPPGMMARFAKRPRARGGKDIRFIPEIIANEYARHFTRKSVEDLDETQAKLFLDWADLLHQEFAEEHDGWTAIQSQPERAAKTFDQLALHNGWQLPSALPDEINKLQSDVWPKCVLAFDAQQMVMDASSPVVLHAVVALRLNQLRAAGIEFSSKMKQPLQESITTQTSAGLSWLFGSGLNRIRESESIEEMAAGLGVPKELTSRVMPVWLAAKSIGQDTLFGAKGYSDYRRLVGGRLDSWIANYLTRLLELKEMLDRSAEPFRLDQDLVDNWDRWFGRLPLKPATVQTLADEAYLSRDNVKRALSVLCGETFAAVTKVEVDAVERFSSLASEAAGALRAMQKVLEPSEDDGVVRDQSKPSATSVQIPDWLKELPRLNSFSGAIPDFEKELLETVRDHDALETAYKRTMSTASQWETYGDKNAEACAILRLAGRYIQERDPGFEPVSRIDEGTASRIVDHLLFSKALEDVNRRLAQRLARAALTCSLEGRQLTRRVFLNLGIFADHKDANRFFLNQQGALWRSPFSRSRHEAFSVGQVVHRLDMLSSLRSSIAASLANREMVSESDAIRLEHAADSLLISGLGGSALAKLQSIPLDERYARVPTSLRIGMQAPVWTVETAVTYFNLIRASRLSMLALIERKKFFVRARFQRVGDTELLYRPKNVQWQPPSRLFETRTPIGDTMRLVDSAIADRTINAAELTSTVVESKAISDEARAAYLRQAPHEWHYCAKFVDEKDADGYLAVDGKKGPASKVSKRSTTGRLVGPPSYKSELDKLLPMTGRSSFGDITVIFDQEFTQSFERSSSGELAVNLKPGALVASVAIPLTIDSDPSGPFPYSDRLVAIDQGEAGLGFAVIDVRTREVVASGTRRVPSIKRLINKAKRYRSIAQKSQKFQQRFDSTMFNMRENVVGDVCHVICELMHAYQAFPALESQVGNLEGGSRQLDLVYKAVTARFCFSDVDAQNTARHSYWMGGDYWEHPFLKTEEWKNGKYTGKFKPLNLFPGVRAPTGGTSQQCSCCKGNPIRELRAMMENSTQLPGYYWQGDGKLELPSGEILLNTTSRDGADWKKARRRMERSSIRHPLESVPSRWEDVISIARRNLRQAPLSRQSRDTTQSVYQCLYVHCGNRMQADENAAINIGRRFLEERTKVVS